MQSNVKKTQLEGLIRTIVNQLLTEMEASMSATDMNQIMASNPQLDPSVNPQDQMSAVEKLKLKRQADMDKTQQIKQKEIELDTAKKQLSFQQHKSDEQKRIQIPTLTKDLQKLKGAAI